MVIVYCIKIISDIGLELDNGHFGKVMIKYFDHWGYMCSEDYSDKEANVICRQLGYNGGFAYHYTNPVTWNPITSDIRWLRNINCTGKENNIFNCDRFELGQIGDCSISTYAAAYCFSDNGQFSIVFFIDLITKGWNLLTWLPISHIHMYVLGYND